MTRAVQWPRLCVPAFSPVLFVATKWDDAAAKAKMANALLAFIARGMPRSAFTRPLYARVSNMFGFIAHHCAHGFWDEYFASTEGRVRFLEQIDSHPGWGHPTSTWSDVERSVIERLRLHPVLDAYRIAARQDQHESERVQLARLLARHGSPGAVMPQAAPAQSPEQLGLL